MFESKIEIRHLTGLRAVAALMVLLLHLDQIHGYVIARYIGPVNQGHLGVDIFFVLSGYILSHVYAQSFERISFRAHALFLWRRLSRIYPVHIAMLLALFIMVAVRKLLNTNFWDLSELPRQLLLLQAWTGTLTWNLPAWSISAEWAAYVLFPVFVAGIIRPVSIAPAVAIIVALLLGFQLFGLSKGIGGAFMGWPALLRVLSEFALGVLAFRLFRNVQPSWRFDVVACCAFICCFLVPFDLAKVVAIGILIPAVAASGSCVRDLLGSGPFVAMGVISYSIYMVHFLLLKLAQNFAFWLGLEHPPAVVGVLLTLGWSATVTMVAAGTYWAIERPARNWCRQREARIFGVASLDRN